MKEWVQLLIGDFKFPHIKIIFPTAPLMPYAALDNKVSMMTIATRGQGFSYLSVFAEEIEHLVRPRCP